MPEKMDNEQGGLNDRLKDFKVEPGEGIWASLEENLARKRKKRPIAIWWFAGAAFFLCLILGTPMLMEKYEKEGRIVSNSNKIAEHTDNQKNNKIVQTEKPPTVSNSEALKNRKSSNPNHAEILNPNPSEADLNNQNREKPNQKDIHYTQSKPAEIMIASEKDGKPKSENSEGKKRTGKPEKVREFTSRLISSLPAIDKKRNQKDRSENREEPKFSENPIQQENPKLVPVEKTENPIITQNEANTKHEVTELNQTKKSGDLVQGKPTEPKELLKNQDSSIVLEPVELKPGSDSTQKEESRKWKRSVWVAPKFAVLRSISINQNSDEKRISLPNNNSEWTNRLAIDLGFRLERSLNPLFAINGFGGFSYLQEQLNINQDQTANGYEIIAENGALTVNPKKEKQSGMLQSQLLAGFAGVGLGISPSKFTTFRISSGAQFRISETIKKELGSVSESNQKTVSFSEPMFFIQTSVSRLVPVGKFNLELEPMVQFYSSTVFQLQPGTASRPVYLGMHIHISW